MFALNQVVTVDSRFHTEIVKVRITKLPHFRHGTDVMRGAITEAQTGFIVGSYFEFPVTEVIPS